MTQDGRTHAHAALVHAIAKGNHRVLQVGGAGGRVRRVWACALSISVQVLYTYGVVDPLPDF